MEYWYFFPREDITAYELALLYGKLKKIPKTHLIGVSDSVYDSFQNSVHDCLRRHFRLYKKEG